MTETPVEEIKFKPRFEPVINIGHILQVITVASAIIALMMKISGWQVTTELTLATIELRAQKYIPIIESLATDNNISKERFNNMAQFANEQRVINAQLMQAIGDIKADLAVIKARGDSRNGN